MLLIDDIMISDKAKSAAKSVVEALKPHELTIAEVREVLRYIDKTIDHNVVFK